MPANRRPVPKEQKREELLAAAAELLVLDGYEAASMSRIAKRAGVTPNTLYWYFRDKDELLVAVAELYVHALLEEHAALAGSPLAEQLAWLVERLRPVKHLVVTVHNRAALSDVVHAWHIGFHQTFEQLFKRQLPGRVPADRYAAEAATATFALEGAITHDLDDATTRQLCQIVADHLHHVATTNPPPEAARSV
jgi:AcrR family transcriptional regulator